MRVKLKILLAISGMLAGGLLLLITWLWPDAMQLFAQPFFQDRGVSSQQLREIRESFNQGLQTLGALLLLISLTLILMRKKFSNQRFAGIFVALSVLALLLASWVSSGSI